jgi:hypothetical protein
VTVFSQLGHNVSTLFRSIHQKYAPTADRTDKIGSNEFRNSFQSCAGVKYADAGNALVRECLPAIGSRDAEPTSDAALA